MGRRGQTCFIWLLKGSSVIKGKLLDTVIWLGNLTLMQKGQGIIRSTAQARGKEGPNLAKNDMLRIVFKPYTVINAPAPHTTFSWVGFKWFLINFHFSWCTAPARARKGPNLAKNDTLRIVLKPYTVINAPAPHTTSSWVGFKWFLINFHFSWCTAPARAQKSA